MAISPGTWKVSGTREVYSDALPRENCVIAEVLDGSDEDATLIATAPNLLAALKELVHYDEGSSEQGSYGYEVLRRCKSAIAKAEGRSQ